VKMEDSIEVCKVAADTCIWPLYEVENGVYSVSKPKEKKPVTEWLKMQGRFSHLFKGNHQAEIGRLQQHVDTEWERLLTLEKVTQGKEEA